MKSFVVFIFAALVSMVSLFTGHVALATYTGLGLVLGMISNPLLLAEMINYFHPDAVEQGYTQLKLVWRHDRVQFTAAVGDALLFQNAKANYIRNNSQAGFLGNHYGVYFWCKAIIGTTLASTVWIAASSANLCVTDIEISVAGKAYIPRTTILPYLSDSSMPFNSTALVSAQSLNGIVQDGSPSFIAYRPNESFEGHLYWGAAYVATDYCCWSMLGVEASKVEQG